jgi:hypothetical protein
VLRLVTPLTELKLFFVDQVPTSSQLDCQSSPLTLPVTKRFT